MKSILVWDWPVRLGHWLMVGGFALAWLTSESESWRLVHVGAGATVVAVAAFRLLWGIVGSRYARFSAFLRGPGAVLGYLETLIDKHPEYHVGHNPAGGWAIVLLLSLALLTGISGWMNYQELGGDWLEELHEGLAIGMLGVVAIHVGGVVVSSLLHRENLVRAMVTGHKDGEAAEGIAHGYAWGAVVLLGWVAGAVWWLAR